MVMVSSEERRKLVSQMEDEQISPGGAVLKSLAAIVLLFVVAAGPWTLLATDEWSGGATRPPILPVDRGLGESRKVFDERRRDYESAREETAVGVEIPMANSDYD